MWKLVYADSTETWSLYNVSEDAMGLTDVSGSYTRKLTEMKSIIESYKSTSDNLVVPGVEPVP